MGKNCVRPKSKESEAQQLSLKTKLYVDVLPQQWPIVYRKEYNVHFFGLEMMHPFDAKKWRNIIQFLKDGISLTDSDIVSPNEATTNDLLVVHTQQYLDTLKWSFKVAAIAEIPPLALLPNVVVQSSYLKPMRYQTGGTILAGKLALERGWAINIGGGFHHCSATRGGGFCPYGDISLMLQFLFLLERSRVKSAMIVDLDAHQGNGHERDFIGNQNVYILDIYNGGIYPRDMEARKGISREVRLSHFTQDSEYLHLVETNLEDALREFHPDILVYNAGTDILDGDRLGLLAISAQGIIRRDELVFMKARERRVPIAMVTSGGYLKKTARIIADSIINLYHKGLISEPVPSRAQQRHRI